MKIFTSFSNSKQYKETWDLMEDCMGANPLDPAVLTAKERGYMLKLLREEMSRKSWEGRDSLKVDFRYNAMVRLRDRLIELQGKDARQLYQGNGLIDRGSGTGPGMKNRKKNADRSFDDLFENFGHELINFLYKAGVCNNKGEWDKKRETRDYSTLLYKLMKSKLFPITNFAELNRVMLKELKIPENWYKKSSIYNNPSNTNFKNLIEEKVIMELVKLKRSKDLASGKHLIKTNY